jgi:hypothetical protein
VLSLGNKKSSSNTTTNNNDNRQVNDAGGGSIITGGQNNSRPLTIEGSNNQIHMVDAGASLASMFTGMAQAAGAASMAQVTTTGHAVTKAGEAQADAWSLGEGAGKWAAVGVGLLVLAAVVAKVAR